MTSKPILSHETETDSIYSILFACVDRKHCATCRDSHRRNSVVEYNYLTVVPAYLGFEIVMPEK